MKSLAEHWKLIESKLDPKVSPAEVRNFEKLFYIGAAATIEVASDNQANMVDVIKSLNQMNDEIDIFTEKVGMKDI